MSMVGNGLLKGVYMQLLGIELSYKEFDFLMCEQAKGKELKVVDGKVVVVERIITEEEKRFQEIDKLKKLLANTDYQAIKFAEGYLSAEEYEPMKIQRQEWRDRINELGEYNG